MISEEMTIREAKKILRQQVNEGFTCPCCNRFAKQYSRTITSAMAAGLILLYKAPDEAKDPYGYIHLEDYFKPLKIASSIRADIPKLRFWNLIAPDGEDKEDGNPSSGRYKLTENGKLFVENKMSVNSHVKIYNNKFFGYDSANKMITITDALKKKFDYESLMKGEL